MAYRLAPQAEADLEDIAFYVFLDSGSLEIADRLIQSITERFDLLDSHPRRASA
jgi:plasmid stabilization system protein ParE